MNKYILIAITVFVSCMALILWAFPKLITGDYIDVTITKITVDPRGQAIVDFSTISSYRTPGMSCVYDGAENRGGEISMGVGFRIGLSKGSSDLYFSLDPEKLPSPEKAAHAPWHDRLLVHVGDKFHLRSDDRLYFSNFKTADGVQHTAYFEVIGPNS